MVLKKDKNENFLKLGNASELKIDNPAAEITLQSIEIIKKAFEMTPPIRLTVNGEEDCTGIACLYTCS